MPSNAFATALAFLLWAAPTFALDFDEDGVEDGFDNCLEAMNPAQDDTDGDDCGNICDWDYDNSGIMGIPDIYEYKAAAASGSTDEEKCHQEPIQAGCPVGGKAFFPVLLKFGFASGPSGTTAGTTACP